MKLKSLLLPCSSMLLHENDHRWLLCFGLQTYPHGLVGALEGGAVEVKNCRLALYCYKPTLYSAPLWNYLQTCLNDI